MTKETILMEVKIFSLIVIVFLVAESSHSSEGLAADHGHECIHHQIAVSYDYIAAACTVNRPISIIIQ